MKLTKFNFIAASALPGAVVLVASGLVQTARAAEYRHSDSRIAFVQDNASRPGSDIYTMNPDGSDVRQLSDVGANNFVFWENWSADGRQLVFTEFPNDGPGQLWLINADGSNPRLLLAEADYGDYAPSFSPDRAFIVFARCQNEFQGNGCAIYRIGTDGTGLTPLIDFEPEVSNFAPEYSPDGMQIAFESFSRDGYIARIWLMNPDGSDVHPLTPPELTGVNPYWSRDGEKLAFESHCCNPQNNDIWTIHPNGGALTRLTGSASSDREIPVTYYNRGPSWSPRGQAVVFDQYDVKSNTVGIFVVSADGSRANQVLRFSAPRSLRESHGRTDNPRHRNRRRIPREIEENGSLPRWSPELQ